MKIENFKKVKKEAEEFYKSINEIYCPYFEEKIGFNSNGLNHLKFKGWNRGRPIKDQYIRLRLIHLAPEVIRKSKTIQGISKINQFEKRRINSRWERALKKVCFYEFVAVINNTRVKIVLKEIEGGRKFFWTIIPFWKRDDNNRKKMCYGNDLENE